MSHFKLQGNLIAVGQRKLTLNPKQRLIKITDDFKES